MRGVAPRIRRGPSVAIRQSATIATRKLAHATARFGSETITRNTRRATRVEAMRIGWAGSHHVLQCEVQGWIQFGEALVDAEDAQRLGPRLEGAVTEPQPVGVDRRVDRRHEGHDRDGEAREPGAMDEAREHDRGEQHDPGELHAQREPGEEGSQREVESALRAKRPEDAEEEEQHEPAVDARRAGVGEEEAVDGHEHCRQPAREAVPEEEPGDECSDPDVRDPGEQRREPPGPRDVAEAHDAQGDEELSERWVLVRVAAVRQVAARPLLDEMALVGDQVIGKAELVRARQDADDDQHRADRDHHALVAPPPLAQASHRHPYHGRAKRSARRHTRQATRRVDGGTLWYTVRGRSSVVPLSQA